MQVITLDLSEDRTLAEPLKIPKGTRYAQVLRCDLPASIFVNGTSSEPIAAIPGIVIESFYSMSVSNRTFQSGNYGGKLVIGFYKDIPSYTQGRFPYATMLAFDFGNTTGGADNPLAELSSDDVGIDGNVVVTGWQAGFYTSNPSSDWNVELTAVAPQGGTGQVFSAAQNLFATDPPMFREQFPTPLILPTGFGVKGEIVGGDALSVVRIYGYVLRG
jgi:hypothetical protein